MGEILRLDKILRLETTKGQVVIRMRPDLAPNHVERVTRLANEKFYDKRAFFRVIDNFMAQAGCPCDSGVGGSDLADLAPEYSKEEHVRGTVSMARSDHKESANAQFFVCFANARYLDGQFTVWGQVVEGMEVLEAMKRGDPVRDPDRILTATVQ